MTRKNKGKRSNEKADIKNTIIQIEDNINLSNHRLVNKMFRNQIDLQRKVDLRRSLDSSLELLLSSSLERQKKPTNIGNANRYEYERIQAYSKPNFEIKTFEDLSNGFKRVSDRQGLREVRKISDKDSLKKKDSQNKFNSYIDESSNQRPSSISSIHLKNENFTEKIGKTSYEKHLDIIFAKKDAYVPEFGENVENLGNVHEDMVKFFSTIPRYCYFLENEYKNCKEKYNKTLIDFNEQNITIKDLTIRIEELVKESKDLREAVVRLTSENSYLKNNQKVLNGFKEETDHFIEILKMDMNKRNIEMEELIKENNELKIQKSRKEYENEALEADHKRAKFSIERFKAELSLIKSDVGHQCKSIEKMVANINKQEIYGKIFEAEQKIFFLQNYKRFYEENKAVFSFLEENVRAMQIQQSELKSFVQNLQLVNKNKIEELEIKLKKANEMNTNYENLLFVSIKAETESTKEKVEELARKLKIYHEAHNLEGGRRNFAEQLNKQKQEFDASKIKYEKQISELARKLEEQEDVWEVFK